MLEVHNVHLKNITKTFNKLKILKEEIKVMGEV